ncbi:hypothetical protein I4U23_005820 [Adineta vaga]|nr:hypothetical protein I4U23_005820 [Adineta vaga]
MAHYVKQAQSSSVSSPEKNIHPFKTFQLVWLDSNFKSYDENQSTYDALQTIFTHSLTFNDCNQCEHWLKSYKGNEMIILIISGKLSRVIVPRIHHLDAIIGICINCLNRTRYEVWAKNYGKILGIATDSNDLIKTISNYQTIFQSIEDSKSIQIIRKHFLNFTFDSKHASFIWYQLLLEILVSSSYLPPQNTLSQLSQILRQHCANNPSHLATIETFEEKYHSEKVIYWLLCDTFIGHFVGKALRDQNIHILFLCRFLLQDAYLKISSYSVRIFFNCISITPMLHKEIDFFKANQGEYLSFNDFLCASTTRPNIESFENNNYSFQMILLEIHAYIPHGEKSSFLYIDQNLTSGKNQTINNIIFMCGSIFQIDSLTETCNSICILRLKLVTERNLGILTEMKRQLRKNSDLCLIGDLLERCDQHENAIVYFKSLLQNLPAQHIQLVKIQDRLNKLSEIKYNDHVFDLESVSDVQFIVVGLKPHLNTLALAMFDALYQLMDGSIQVFENESDVDLRQFDDKTVFLFTSDQFIARMTEEFGENVLLFILESDPTKVDNQRRFRTGEDLICQLADELYRCYNQETSKYIPIGDIKTTENKKNVADRIHSTLRKVHETITKENNDNSLEICIETIIVWLRLYTQSNETADQIQSDLCEIVSSYLIFNDLDICRQYLSDKTTSAIFLIMDGIYDESIITNFKSLNNVKRLYHYQPLTSASKPILTNFDDLRYQIAYDLIAHYTDLGTKYRANNATEQSRNMFSKAKTLCDFIADL